MNDVIYGVCDEVDPQQKHNRLFWRKLSENDRGGFFWAMPKTAMIHFPEDVPKNPIL